jgi:hypothetical protein
MVRNDRSVPWRYEPKEIAMEPGVKIVVGRGAGPPDWGLDITLTNDTAKPLTMFQHSLPWIGWYSIIMLAVKADAPGTPLERPSPVDDPTTGTIVIQPGETLTGQLSLVKQFPDFAEAIKNRDVIVFWSYQLQTIDGDSLPRTAGYVLFTRTE